MKKGLILILAAGLLSGCSYVHYKGVTYINVGRKFTAHAKTPEGLEVNIEAGVDKTATDAIIQGIEIGKTIGAASGTL